MNRRDELASLLFQALDTPHGLNLTVEGSQPNRRSQAIAALTSVRRELLPDSPELIDLRILPINTTQDQIAILHLPSSRED